MYFAGDRPGTGAASGGRFVLARTVGHSPLGLYRPAHAPPLSDPAAQHDSGDNDADPAEPIPVPMVECGGATFAILEQRNLDGHEARAIDGAVGIPQYLPHSPVTIHPAG
jgi:hypothetical protein